MFLFQKYALTFTSNKIYSQIKFNCGIKFSRHTFIFERVASLKTVQDIRHCSYNQLSINIEYADDPDVSILR